MSLVKVISTELDKAKKRIVKVLRFGKDDVQTSIEASPFGFDSNPVKDLIAVYSTTSEKGKTVIVGYLNKDLLAAVGESRMYSTNKSGELQTFIHLKNDGTIELAGSSDNAVRFTPLSSEMQSLAAAINVELALIATGIGAAGGAYTPGTISIDISGAKIDEIKTL